MPREPSKVKSSGGHRFGPDLVCNECGRGWADHQDDPSPCDAAPLALAKDEPAHGDSISDIEAEVSEPEDVRVVPPPGTTNEVP